MKFETPQDCQKLGGCVIQRDSVKVLATGVSFTVYSPAEEKMTTIVLEAQAVLEFGTMLLNGGAQPIVVKPVMRVQTVEQALASGEGTKQ